MPWEARPQPRSRKGLLGPIVSIPVLRARAVDQDDGREWPGARRQAQGSGQGPFAAADGHFDFMESRGIDVSRRLVG